MHKGSLAGCSASLHRFPLMTCLLQVLEGTTPAAIGLDFMKSCRILGLYNVKHMKPESKSICCLTHTAKGCGKYYLVIRVLKLSLPCRVQNRVWPPSLFFSGVHQPCLKAFQQFEGQRSFASRQIATTHSDVAYRCLRILKGIDVEVGAPVFAAFEACSDAIQLCESSAYTQPTVFHCQAAQFFPQC